MTSHRHRLIIERKKKMKQSVNDIMFENNSHKQCALSVLLSAGFTSGIFFINDCGISANALNYVLDSQFLKIYHGSEIILLMNISDIRKIEIRNNTYMQVSE